MSDNDLLQLQRLMAALTAGQEFYRRAALHAEGPGNREIFTRAAAVRARLLKQLQPFAEPKAEPCYAFGSVLCKLYPDMLLGLDASVDQDLVEASKLQEVATRNAMREAFQNTHTPCLNALLRDIYPELNCQFQGWSKAS